MLKFSKPEVAMFANYLKSATKSSCTSSCLPSSTSSARLFARFKPSSPLLPPLILSFPPLFFFLSPVLSPLPSSLLSPPPILCRHTSQMRMQLPKRQQTAPSRYQHPSEQPARLSAGDLAMAVRAAMLMRKQEQKEEEVEEEEEEEGKG
eukprot:766942-Hanusia_phi.AAC.2